LLLLGRSEAERSIDCLGGAGINCCSDVVEVCLNVFEDLIKSTQQLGNGPTVTPATLNGAQPACQRETLARKVTRRPRQRTP